MVLKQEKIDFYLINKPIILLLVGKILSIKIIQAKVITLAEIKISANKKINFKGKVEDNLQVQDKHHHN